MDFDKSSISVRKAKVHSKPSTCWQERYLLDQPVRKRNYKFLNRLMEMLSDSKHHEVVSWSEDGSIIDIKDDRAFVNEVLPLHFKHCSMPNFVRQLNMYDFKKVKRPCSIIGYKNPLFNRDHKGLISKISRKGSNQQPAIVGARFKNKQSSASTVENENILDVSNSFLSEPDNEATLSQKFNSLKQKVGLLECRVQGLELESRNLIEHKNEISMQANFSKDYICMLETLILRMTKQSITRTELQDLVSQSDLVELNSSTDSSSANTEIFINNSNLVSAHKPFNSKGLCQYKVETTQSPHLLCKKRFKTKRAKGLDPQQSVSGVSTSKCIFPLDKEKDLIDVKSSTPFHQTLFINTEYPFSKSIQNEQRVEPFARKLEYDFDVQGLVQLFHYGSNETSSNLNSGEPIFSDSDLFN